MILINVFVRKLKTETDLLIRPARFSLKFAKLPGITSDNSRVRNGWGPVSGGRARQWGEMDGAHGRTLQWGADKDRKEKKGEERKKEEVREYV